MSQVDSYRWRMRVEKPPPNRVAAAHPHSHTRSVTYTRTLTHTTHTCTHPHTCTRARTPSHALRAHMRTRTLTYLLIPSRAHTHARAALPSLVLRTQLPVGFC